MDPRESSSGIVPQQRFERDSTALLRLLSLLHRAWLSLSANLLNFSRDFRHEPLPTRVRLPIFIVIRLEYEVNSLPNVGWKK